MEIAVKNRFSLGDRLECVHPDGNVRWIPERMETAEGRLIKVAPGDGHRVWIDMPENRVGAFVARFLNDFRTAQPGPL
jgi:putative protease